MTWLAVCDMDELKLLPWLNLQVQGQPLILFCLDETPVCYLDRCSHQDVRLSDFGKRDADQLLCFAHGAVFSLADGAVLRPPACQALTAFPCRLKGGKVEVELDLAMVGDEKPAKTKGSG